MSDAVRMELHELLEDLGVEEDALFVWLRDVRAEVCEKKKRGNRAA